MWHRTRVSFVSPFLVQITEGKIRESRKIARGRLILFPEATRWTKLTNYPPLFTRFLVFPRTRCFSIFHSFESEKISKTILLQLLHQSVPPRSRIIQPIPSNDRDCYFRTMDTNIVIIEIRSLLSKISSQTNTITPSIWMPPVFPQLLEKPMPLANALRHFRQRKAHTTTSLSTVFFFFFNRCTSRGVYGGGFRPFSKTESQVGRSRAHPTTEWRFEFVRTRGCVHICIYMYICITVRGCP